MINISFSWDDGSIYDMRLAILMLKYDIKAVFFIPTKNWENTSIELNDIKNLNNMGMEIGGHTVSHKYLTTLPIGDIKNEIRDNKYYLEDIISDSVDIFCYPGGFYNKEIEEITKKYYIRARSAKTMRFGIQSSFTVDTSFHFYPRGVKSIFKNVLQNDRSNFLNIAKSFSFDIFEYYKNILQNLDKNKDYNIHIWGHGWEIEKYNLWEKLEDFIKFLRDNKFEIISNSKMYL